MKKNVSLLIGYAVLICVVAAAAFGLSGMRSNHSDERLRSQRRAIERAAVLCYALEGQYPPNVNHLEDKYGLIIDREKYIVHYETYGSNIRPEIEVYAYD